MFITAIEGGGGAALSDVQGPGRARAGRTHTSRSRVAVTARPGQTGSPLGSRRGGCVSAAQSPAPSSQRTVPEAGEVAAALARARPSALLCLQDEFLLGTECRGPVSTSGTRAEKQH